MNRFKKVAILFAFAALCFAAGTVYHIVSTGEGIVSSICLSLGCGCFSYICFNKKTSALSLTKPHHDRQSEHQSTEVNKMKHYFIVSLCKNGILGGGIVADAEAITYHTGKLTVPAQYRHLEMKYRDIRALTSDRLLLLPTVTVTMTDGAEYKFIVFARNRFLALMREMGVAHEA